MLIGPAAILLLTAGGVLYVGGALRRVNIEGINVFAAICISTFVSAIIFFQNLVVTPLTVFAAQCFGAAIYISLLLFAFKYAIIGRRNFVERSIASRKRLVGLCIIAPIALYFIDYISISYGSQPACRSLRCEIIDIIMGYDRNFQTYYIISWFGILIISATITSILQLIRFKN